MASRWNIAHSSPLLVRAPLGRGREGGVGRLLLLVHLLVDLDAVEVEVVLLEELEHVLAVPVVRDAPRVAPAGVLHVQLGAQLDQLLAALQLALPRRHHQWSEAAARLQVDVALARVEESHRNLWQLGLQRQMERGHAVLVQRVHVAALFGERGFKQLGLVLVLAHGLDERRVHGRRLLLDVGRVTPVWGVDRIALRVVRIDLGEAGIHCPDHRE
mmetsp:Transcript_9729/g.24188  ORF Transcript_9729/g.24188 Transcript_9729/m.24188 type:complete len:215 (+) Transcript_9729:139-783(+)|eukprot:CAMPEP_0118819202 /NCGR_PEP_ID=MMETSP1162-20130426/6756_1 /TAXON_ID=33656 /ORGANISM="Phaeocystis Sp, Strain CCMP2710" /LENGTH=214 /DNA_ID=CAMNT_0006749463 /DNA_START=138 /DNA_END=782 /DNA_ORIENTATION=-